MIKYIISAFIILGSAISYAQDFSLTEKQVKLFNAQIKKLKMSESNVKALRSFPQTTAYYFEIRTKSPQTFIKLLKETKNFDQLANKFENLIVDKDLLIIKNVYPGYKNVREIEISSFDIGNSSRHLIRFAYNDSLNNNNLPYFFNTYTHKNITTVSGFYLKSNFVSIAIADKYANWISYNDKLISPEKPIFLNLTNKLTSNYKQGNNIVDTLISYFNQESNKATYSATNDPKLVSLRINNWKNSKHAVAERLYKKDKKFRKLLNDALKYAEENSFTNEDLEDMLYSTIPKARALNLLRQAQTVGTCSFDDRPLEQLKRIAVLAGETADWSLFIKSALNILNDNVARVAQSNIASNGRKTYVEELAKLNLDLNSVLLGSNFRINDTSNTHYFSDGEKIAKAYSMLSTEHQNTFQKTIKEITKSPTTDAFNKLHFYNTYRNFKYLVNDRFKLKEIDEDINSLTSYLPYEIKSRIDDPNKSLKDLLFRESSFLNRFDVLDSSIGSIYSYSYSGMCWKATIIEKNENNKIVYDLTMPINEEITPLQNFINQKDSLKLAVVNNNFLQQQLMSHSNGQIYIEFTNDKSFSDHNNNVTKYIPNTLLAKLNFNNAISLYIKNAGNNYYRYVLLQNNDVLTIQSSRSIETKDTFNLYSENGAKIY